MERNPKNIGQILQTKNYGMFKFHNENRSIIHPHVNTLVRSMLSHGWVRGSIAVVDSSYNIIDGQHRILAAQIANVPVIYTVDKKITTNEIGILNSHGRNWNIITHLERFVKLEYKHYMVLDRFMKNFPDFRPTECTMLVRNGLGSAERETFENGKFETKNMDLAYQWGRNVMSLKPYFEKGYNKSIFVRAMIKVLSSKPEFHFDEFLHKVKMRPKSIFMCGTVDQYVQMIEDIYNYRRSEKINLRF
jgi:hypothetical protein